MTQEHLEGPAEVLLALRARVNTSQSSYRSRCTSLLDLGVILPVFFSSDLSLFTFAELVRLQSRYLFGIDLRLRENDLFSCISKSSLHKQSRNNSASVSPPKHRVRMCKSLLLIHIRKTTLLLTRFAKIFLQRRCDRKDWLKCFIQHVSHKKQLNSPARRLKSDLRSKAPGD